MQTGSGGTFLPPHNVEAERSVLGAILVQNESLDRVRDSGLEARDFYREDHQRIFEAALGLAERREPVDLVTLTSALRDRGWYDQVGGTQTLTSLFDNSFAAGNVGYYAKIVREKAVLRRMISACTEIMESALGGVPDTDVFLGEAEEKVFAVSDLHMSKAVVSLKEVVLQNMETIEALSMRKEEVTGVPTGFTEFDRLTSGLHPGQVMILAARPGMGKTSWFLSALQNAALTGDRVVALFSLEMSKEELGVRFLSGLSRIESKKLKTGRLADADWQRLTGSADRLSKARIFIDDSGGLTAMDLRGRARRLLSSEKRIDLIVIDYLQLMKGSRAARGGEASREREISEISRNLKELAKELRVPIIALSQLNRGVESRQDKRPNLSDLRESGAIEQDADLVCFIHRDDYYNRDSEEKGIAEFIIAKNRAGETGVVRMAWLGQYTLFANLAPDSPGTPVGMGRPDRGDVTL